MDSATTPMNPQAVADHVRHGMLANDRATRALGMEITSMGPGHATITMAVRADMLNGFDTCHGGYITTLADSAFAFACNSHNTMTVASGLSVDFLAPGREGDAPGTWCTSPTAMASSPAVSVPTMGPSAWAAPSFR